jgi:hypothetical protein
LRVLRQPHEAIGLLPYTTGLAAALSIALVSIKLWRQQSYPSFTPVVGIALGVFVVASIVALSCGRRQIALPRWMDASGLTAWMLGLQCGVLLLVVPVILLTKSVAADDVADWTFGILNKRWLIGLYQVAIVTFLLCPIAIYRWHSGPGEAHRAVDRLNGGYGWLRAACGALSLAALAWYFAGPPWHLERHHRPIDWHEQAVLGPLQAISKGYIPYIGPASTQYGPGAQVLIYTLMTEQRAFDIVSFRTACAILNFAALAAVGLAAYCWVGFAAAVPVIVLATIYSPFAFFSTAGDGTFAGFYGWGFAGRYLAPLLVVPALARECFASEGGRRWWGLMLWGGVLGTGAWIAQENLSTTVMAGGLVLAILWLTGTVRIALVGRIVLALSIGVACVAVPILAWYARHHAAGEYVRNYFLVPHAVAMGYSNIWWPSQDAARPDRYSYYFTLPFLILSALAALWRFPALRLEAPLDWRRARFIAFVCVLLACYQTSLLRSDAAHVMNTMIALPFVLVLGALDLPRWVASTRGGRIGARVAFIALALAIYPTIRLQNWSQLLVTPIRRFQPVASAQVADPSEERIAFERATPLLADEPLLAGGADLSMRTFLDFATGVHAIAGTRRTLVTDLGGRAWTGALYFLADLTPAPYPFDRETMAINAELRAAVVDHVRAHPSDYECLIGTSPEDPAAVAFLETHPGAVARHLVLPAGGLKGPRTVHILLAGAQR